MYLFLVDNCEHEKAKGANKNIIATIIHNEYKDVLLNKKCTRHSMDRIQSKDHQIAKYEISLSCFDDKIYILKAIYMMDYLLVIRVNYKKQLSK